MTVTGTCKECERPVERFETAVYPIQGYEVTRDGKGGQNHVVRKARVDGWVWHKHCWDALMIRKHGAQPHQESLL